MKKLLALVLCVMMFVAVIPTAAFAVTIPTSTTFPTTSGSYVPKWAPKDVAKDAVDDATDNIMAMYQTLAADKGVFATVSAIDGVVTGIAKEIWKDSDGLFDLDASAAEKATKNLFRDVIGNEIMNYMDKHWQAFASANDDGTFDINPLKYMEVFATAASKAVSSDKAVANIQAIVTTLASMQAYEDFRDDLDDLASDITLWNDNDGIAVWQMYFGQDPTVDPWDPYALFEPTAGGAPVFDMGDSVYVPFWIYSHS